MTKQYKPEFTETATPMLEIWTACTKRRYPMPRKSSICSASSEPGTALTKEEEQELAPVVSTLMIAGVESQQMSAGVLVATLHELAQSPPLSSAGELPAAVQWELANDYQRDEEMPGTFAMDIWGTNKRSSLNIRGSLSQGTSPAPPNILRPEYRRIAQLGDRGKEIVVYRETGPFHEFLELVLDPLKDFLREPRLPPMTVESIVRIALDAPRGRPS
jgi:hypothetical protein